MDIKQKFLQLTKRTYPHGTEKDLFPLLSDKLMEDEFGNLFINIGISDTMFTSHLDTATSALTDVNHVFEGKIIKTDGKVCFANAEEIYNKYRAFTPWPGVYLESGLKLKKIALHDDEKHANAGEILLVEKDYIVVACLEGALRIYTVQPESKNVMSVLSYINGKRLSIADTLV
jgi:methionyl-tRNA formyltransferase